MSEIYSQYCHIPGDGGSRHLSLSMSPDSDESNDDQDHHLHHLHQPLEQSYERDSRWKPHLSWSHLSWKLQQRMEEQALQRELAWQKIADKLGPLIISSDGGLTFGRADYSAATASGGGGGGAGDNFADEEAANHLLQRAQERTPFYSQKLSYSTGNINSNNFHSTATSTNTTNHSSQATTSKLSTNFSSHYHGNAGSGGGIQYGRADPNGGGSGRNHFKSSSQAKHDKARRRCMTVSGILIALIFLLFTIVVLMALGILHR